jgi:hypothetical protein
MRKGQLGEKGEYMKVKSYDSKYELPKKQQDILKRIVHEKTGLDEGDITFGTSGKVQAVFSDSELWLMMEGTLSKEEHEMDATGLFRNGFISSNIYENNWIAKVFIFLKLKGPEKAYESFKDAQKISGLHLEGDEDMEDFLKEITYKAQKMYNEQDDIDVDLKGFVLPNSDIVLFLLLWRKSIMSGFQ